MKKSPPNINPRRLFDSSSSSTSNSGRSNVKKEVADTGKDIDSVQCRACSGYGHYSNECPTARRRQKNNFNAVLSDDSDAENDSDQRVLFINVMEEDDQIIDALNDIDELDIEKCEVEDEVLSDVEAEATEISPNTTNWYEMTLLDEFNHASEIREHDPHEEQPTASLQEPNNVVNEVCTQWTTQSKELRFLMEENQCLRGKIVSLEIRLIRSDAEISKLKKEVEDTLRTFQKWNQGTNVLNEALTL
ncbi:hypothetical protein C2S52_015725 [Perilla frutescens var. hirtella]|nr:hypothetical protein C2S52_015725 [Perilla frutescens var. hirtella]